MSGFIRSIKLLAPLAHGTVFAPAAYESGPGNFGTYGAGFYAFSIHAFQPPSKRGQQLAELRSQLKRLVRLERQYFLA